MDFMNAAQLLDLCGQQDISLAEAMRRREVELTGVLRARNDERMRRTWQVMQDAIHTPLEKPARSMGGLIGGEAAKLDQRTKIQAPVCGAVVANAITYAIGVLEVNASMGLIVAAPTAGSSGVIPGAFAAVQAHLGHSEDDIVDALWCAAAVGYLITLNGTVSGAQGGCQAEVGSASAMAAAGVVQLMGGTPKTSLDAAGIAITNLLGLVCDPIAGLVESPCQTRNALGAAGALVAAELALAGVALPVPFDEVVDAMSRVGASLPYELRETALGGVAATATACRLAAGGCGDCAK